MPVQIGAKTHDFNDPMGLLSDCHRRVEMFLGTLAAVAKVIDHPPTDETRRALDSALRYFKEAAPKHTADEEESLFPRLRQIHDLQLASTLSNLDRLDDDHRCAAPVHSRLDRLGTQYLSNGRLSAEEVDEFRTSVAHLVPMYKEHISIEDQIVFPLAARLLSLSDKSAIANEMAKRRNLT